MLVLSRGHLSRVNLYEGTEWIGAIDVQIPGDSHFVRLVWITSPEEATVEAELIQGARMTVKVDGFTMVFTVVEQKPTKVRLGVEAPPEVQVLREECEE